jgi:hypothetical protein
MIFWAIITFPFGQRQHHIYEKLLDKNSQGHQKIKGEALLFLPNWFRSFLGKNRRSFHLQPSNNEK